MFPAHSVQVMTYLVLPKKNCEESPDASVIVDQTNNNNNNDDYS